MLDVGEFLETYYDIDTENLITLEKFENIKEANGIKEWDYPLDEYKHIAELDLNCVPVRFDNGGAYYEYRFCEVPEELMRKGR